MVVLLLVLGCASPEERFAEHVARAQGYIEQGRTDDALIELQSALKIDPDDADVNEKLAQLLKKRGSTQAAAFHFGEAYRLDPTRVGDTVEQATLLWRTAPRRAQEIIRAAKQRFPNDARVYRGEAVVLGALKNPDAALAAAKRAVKLAPKDKESWATLGAIYIQRTREARRGGGKADPADYAAGVEAFDQLDALSGGYVGARVEKARLLGHSGDREKAVAAFRSAIDLAKQQKNSGAVVYAAQRFAGYAGKIDATDLEIEALRELVAASPKSVRQWDALSRAVGRRDGAKAAEAVYKELLEKQSKNAGAHYAYATYLVRTGRPVDAIAHLDRTLGDGLDSPLLWEQLALLELAQHRVADARATIDEMKDRYPDHEFTRRSEARLAIEEHRNADALKILNDFAGAKATADTELLRAQAERNLGNLANAAAAAERAVALASPGDVTALRLKATIHSEARDWEATLKTLDRITAAGHELAPLEQVLKARALYEMGDAERGHATLEKVLSRPASPPAAAVEFARREAAKNPAEARAHLTKALRLVPGNYDALAEITKLDLAQGHEALALKRLDHLVESQLAGPRVLLLRAQVLLRGGQLDRAEADALRAFEALPELPDAVDLLFTIYQAENKLDEARRSFEEADSVGVLHKGARVLLARLEMANGSLDKARALYEKVLAEDDGMVAAKLDLARLLSSEGKDLDRALELGEQAQRAQPDDPAIADTVGYVYYLKGRHEVALQQFRLALKLSGAAGIDPPAVHYHVGLALAALGRNAEAIPDFEHALKLDPSFSEADDAREHLKEARAAAAQPQPQSQKKSSS